MVSQAVKAQMAIWAETLAHQSARFGSRVEIDTAALLDRSADGVSAKLGIASANGSCRLVATLDGWIAVNMARESDRSALAAWIGPHDESAFWTAIEYSAAGRMSREIASEARLLGMPVAIVDEVHTTSADARLVMRGSPNLWRRTLDVVDLTSMWAGPLCGDLLAQMGARVTKVESRTRPDGVRLGSPGLYARLNDRKLQVVIDFAAKPGLAWLRERILAADMVLTSARPRAFVQLGIAPDAMFAANPGLIWVAVSGYGWTGDNADRTAFGDDAAAAGGLVDWTPAGEPRFHGDAIADPLTGVAAVVGALRALEQGGGILVDAALAMVTAGVAHRITRSGNRAL